MRFRDLYYVILAMFDYVYLDVAESALIDNMITDNQKSITTYMLIP